MSQVTSAASAVATGGKFRQGGALAIGVVIFAAAAAVMALELPYEALGRLPAEESVTMRAALGPPLSERAGLTLAESFYDLIGSTFFAALSTTRREQMLRGCEDDMVRLVTRVPDHGLARLVLAQIAGLRGDARFNKLMAESAAHAPNSTWLRLRRLDLGFAYGRLLDAAGHDLATADIDALLASQGGRDALARRYISGARSAEAIRSRVEAQPQAVQRLFVAAVRQASGAG